MTRTFRAAFAIAILASAVPALAADDASDIRSAGRAALEKYGPAVVTVEIVSEIKVSYGGREQTQERKTETLGSVIDGDGVVVTALSSVDPTKLWENMQRPGSDAEFATTVKSMKYILADNTEVAAQLVLRDSDLDLAFLRATTTPATPMVALDLSGDAEPQVLSEAFCIGRMGRIARRTHLAMTGEIQGVVRKPRPFYVPSAELASAGTGVPVFATDGRLYGLVFLHSLPGGLSEDERNDEFVTPVVIPVADIRSAIQEIPARND